MKSFKGHSSPPPKWMGSPEAPPSEGLPGHFLKMVDKEEVMKTQHQVLEGPPEIFERKLSPECKLKVKENSLKETWKDAGDREDSGFDWVRHFRTVEGSSCWQHRILTTDFELGLAACDPETQGFVTVEPSLTFRKYFGFMHPVYGAKIRIDNPSNIHVAFKVFPSDTEKLCMREFQGILAPGTSGIVTVATNSMVPYKYVDILEETIEVAYAGVTLLESARGNLLGNACDCCWNKLNPGQLDTFWSLHSPGSDEGVGVTKIVGFIPYDATYLSEESVMWAEWGPCKFLRQKTWIWDGIMETFSCDFDDEKHFFWTWISYVFPNSMRLERTQRLVAPKKKYTPLELKQKMLKVVILSVLIAFRFNGPPLPPYLKHWLDR